MLDAIIVTTHLIQHTHSKMTIQTGGVFNENSAADPHAVSLLGWL